MIPLQIDIVKLAQIIGALSVVLGAIVGGYKLYDKLIDRMTALEKRVSDMEVDLERVKKEDTIVIYALRACLDGLHQKGCNGKVTEAIEMIDKHLNKAAHDQDG